MMRLKCQGSDLQVSLTDKTLLMDRNIAPALVLETANQTFNLSHRMSQVFYSNVNLFLEQLHEKKNFAKPI